MVAKPKGDVPGNLVCWKEKDQGIQAQKVKVGFPFTDYNQEDSQYEKYHGRSTCFWDKITIKINMCSSG
jgi:hypothetical protein